MRIRMPLPLLLLVLTALVAAACSAGETDTEPATTAPAPADTPAATDQPGIAVVANAPGTLGTGPQRLVVGLLTRDAQSLASPDLPAHIDVFFESTTNLVAELPGAFQWTVEGARGVYVATVTFDQPGNYGVRVRPEGMEPTAPAAFVVVEDPVVPEVGEPAPAVETPTGADQPLEQISTDPDPDPRFYELSLDEALANGRPTVVVFATPAFCQTATCGPMLDQVKAAAPAHPDVNFIHVEVYEDFEGVTDVQQLQLAPAVSTWGFPSEPWVYVIDAGGVVSARFEGSMSTQELEDALAELS